MVARDCRRCGGPLRVIARFCTIIALKCQVCGTLHRQSVPPAVAVTIAA